MPSNTQSVQRRTLNSNMSSSNDMNPTPFPVYSEHPFPISTPTHSIYQPLNGRHSMPFMRVSDPESLRPIKNLPRGHSHFTDTDAPGPSTLKVSKMTPTRLNAQFSSHPPHYPPSSYADPSTSLPSPDSEDDEDDDMLFESTIHGPDRMQTDMAARFGGSDALFHRKPSR